MTVEKAGARHLDPLHQARDLPVGQEPAAELLGERARGAAALSCAICMHTGVA